MRIKLITATLILMTLLSLTISVDAQIVLQGTDKRSQIEELKKILKDKSYNGDPNDLRIFIITLLLELKAPFTEILEVVDIDSKYPNKVLFDRAASLLADRKEYLDQALELIDKAISAPHIPNDAIYYEKFEITRGYVYLQRGEIDKALGIFTKLEKQMPYDASVLSYLGMAYQRTGRLDEAIDAYLRQHGLYYYTAPSPPGDLLITVYREKFGSLDGLEQRIQATWLAMRRKVYVENVRLDIPAPEWTLNNLSGEPSSLVDFSGKILILCFLQFGNAREDVDRLKAIQKMYSQYENRGVAVVCIGNEKFLKGQGRIEAIEALREARITLPVLTYKEKTEIQGYKTYEEPWVFVIDGRGIICFKHSLYNREYQIPLTEQLNDLLTNPKGTNRND